MILYVIGVTLHFHIPLPTDKYALLTTTYTGNYTGKIGAVEVLQTDLDGFPGKYFMKDVGDTELLVTLGTSTVPVNDSFELSKYSELLRISDFDGGNKRYEGTFYNATSPWIPFTPIDRFKVDFVNQSETLSSHIDHMVFNLKQNTYEVRTHTEVAVESTVTQTLTLSANKPS